MFGGGRGGREVFPILISLLDFCRTQALIVRTKLRTIQIKFERKRNATLYR